MTWVPFQASGKSSSGSSARRSAPTSRPSPSGPVRKCLHQVIGEPVAMDAPDGLAQSEADSWG
eukprot:13375985-Alexandrium_andersonii.AAC.1